MKNISIACILSLCTLNLHSEHQPSPFFVHHKRVKSTSGAHVKLQNYTPHIDVTYVPQQVVQVKNNPTKLPLIRHTYSHGIQHIKCVLSTESPQKKADRKTLELLVRKEPLGKIMAEALDKNALMKGHKAVVRLYQKATPDINHTGKTCWKPILTLPETGNTHKLLEGIKVTPEGTIHLENS